MKKTIVFIAAMSALLMGCSSGDPKPQAELGDGATVFSFSVVPATNFQGLPALQSFVMGRSGQYWLMLGGRINGFHQFPNSGNQAFPHDKANTTIFVYDTVAQHLYTMSTGSLPAALQEQYSFTNMESTQVGDYLYVCGGYGLANAGQADSAYVTDSTLSRITVSAMVQAVISQNAAAVAAAVVYDQNPNILVCATGGELYKLQDGNFYLNVGHRYYGAYLNNNAVQIYLDSVHVFNVTETATSISINSGSARYITDFGPNSHVTDSTSQFRRRDLVVAPAIQSDKQSVGLSIYGGVFTNYPGSQSTPFTHPIYISTSTTAPYTVDPYNQHTNNYSAPHFEMYSAAANRMYTTIFGGICSQAADSNNPAFTKKILTLNHDYTAGNTTEIYNADSLATLMGAEAVFVPANINPSYVYNASYNIVSFDALPLNQNVSTLVGYIYGGIVSQTNQSTLTNTSASGTVYKVYLTKYAAGSNPGAGK